MLPTLKKCIYIIFGRIRNISLPAYRLNSQAYITQFPTAILHPEIRLASGYGVLHWDKEYVLGGIIND